MLLVVEVRLELLAALREVLHMPLRIGDGLHQLLLRGLELFLLAQQCLLERVERPLALGPFLPHRDAVFAELNGGAERLQRGLQLLKAPLRMLVSDLASASSRGELLGQLLRVPDLLRELAIDAVALSAVLSISEPDGRHATRHVARSLPVHTIRLSEVTDHGVLPLLRQRTCPPRTAPKHALRRRRLSAWRCARGAGCAGGVHVGVDRAALEQP
mmetsp:Transcript_106727/g.331499  ORF Transcript_106727/g.331499 Transcript_106727/m.331499 type:complete len:215 (+) Transcript_106727:900-1544(+)